MRTEQNEGGQGEGGLVVEHTMLGAAIHAPERRTPLVHVSPATAAPPWRCPTRLACGGARFWPVPRRDAWWGGEFPRATKTAPPAVFVPRLRAHRSHSSGRSCVRSGQCCP